MKRWRGGEVGMGGGSEWRKMRGGMWMWGEGEWRVREKCGEWCGERVKEYLHSGQVSLLVGREHH